MSGVVMIVPISDELIMAYADGELDGPLAHRVRDALPNDDAIRRKYEMFHATRRILSRAFDSILDEPVPQRLIKTVKTKTPRTSN